MNFTVPFVLHDPLTNEYWKQVYPDDKFKAKLAYHAAKNVYVRNRLAEAQNWHCCWCGCETIPESGKDYSATIEHVIPRSKGGSDDQDNLAMSCHKCNKERDTIDALEFMMFIKDGNTIVKVFSKKRSKTQRFKEKREARRNLSSQVIAAIAAGETNPFEKDSKAWRMFNRYARSTHPTITNRLTLSV